MDNKSPLSSWFALFKISMLNNRKIPFYWFIALMVTCCSVVLFRYFGNLISGKILDALNSKKASEIFLMLCFATLCCIFVAFIEILKRYAINVTCLKMRESLYLYYGVDVIKNKKCDFICQRMSSELASFSDRTITLIYQAIEVMLSFFTFLIVLYEIGGIKIIAGGVVYAVFGIFVTKILAKSVKKFVYQRSDAEALLRRELVNETQKPIGSNFLLPSIKNLIDISFKTLKTERNLGFFRQVFDDFKTYFTYLILLPIYLSGGITVGSMYRAVGAFRYVMRGFGFVADNRLNITGISVSVKRIKEME